MTEPEQPADPNARFRAAVLVQALLNIVNEFDTTIKTELKATVDSEQAMPVRMDGHKIGKVRRNKESVSWRVYDWGALERWVQENVPNAWITRPQVSPPFLEAVKKTGQYIDADGVIHDVPGLERQVKPGSLYVDAEEAAEEYVRHLFSVPMKEIES